MLCVTMLGSAVDDGLTVASAARDKELPRELELDAVVESKEDSERVEMSETAQSSPSSSSACSAHSPSHVYFYYSSSYYAYYSS